MNRRVAKKVLKSAAFGNGAVRYRTSTLSIAMRKAGPIKPKFSLPIIFKREYDFKIIEPRGLVKWATA